VSKSARWSSSPSLIAIVLCGLAGCRAAPTWGDVGVAAAAQPSALGADTVLYFALPGRELSDRMEQGSLVAPPVLMALRRGGFESRRVDGFAGRELYAQWVGAGEGMGIVVLDAQGEVLATRPGPQDPPELAAYLDLIAARRGPIAAARAAVRAAPDDPQAALQLGVMLLELGCRREPEALLERAYAAGLEAAAVRLAHLCALDGDLQPARFWLARAAPSPATSVTQGYVLYKERRHGEAAQVLRAAIGAGGLGADLPRAQLFLGKALHENLRDQEAVPVLEAVVRDWPDTTFAGAALHTLQHIRNPVHGHTH